MKKFIVFFGLVILAVGIFFGIQINNGMSNNKLDTSSPGSAITQKSTANAKVLNLSNKGLSSVGPDIYGKTDTTDLILSNNNIKTLPSQMGKMTRVVLFKIDHNLLEGSLIGEIRQMSGLKTLDLSYNNMTGMPAEIGQLTKLESLNYSYNNINGLPNELANLKNNLKEFNLTGNPLSQDKISKLRASLPNTNVIF